MNGKKYLNSFEICISRVYSITAIWGDWPTMQAACEAGQARLATFETEEAYVDLFTIANMTG